MAESEKTLTPALSRDAGEGGDTVTPADTLTPALSREAGEGADTSISRASADAGWTQYEVNVELDPAIGAEFDQWLPDHIDEILRLPGFTGADILAREPVEQGPHRGWLRRTVQYRLTDPRHLDSYLRDHAERLRADARARFGERASFERRVLTQNTHRMPGAAHLEYCRNCGAALGGQYCASCGQRSRVRLISLWELIKEATGTLTDLDSRIWRTARLLLFRPGVLTREYLAGRRARYIPPFRLYIVLSIAFFVLASFANDEETSVDVDDGGVTDTGKLTPGQRAEVTKDLDEAMRELRDAGLMPSDAKDEPRDVPAAEAESTAEEDASSKDAESKPDEEASDDKAEDDPCQNIQLSAGPELEERVREACRKIRADSGDRLGQAMIANIPKMMFVFLPLLALVNKAMYPFSRRYYVEHLLFFVHYHAFVFLLFSVAAAFAIGAGAIPGLTVVYGILVTVIVFYLPIYLYKAMRRVYGQGHLLTLLKFGFLFVAYFICLLVTFVGMAAYTALTL